jgi:hypothetical protein
VAAAALAQAANSGTPNLLPQDHAEDASNRLTGTAEEVVPYFHARFSLN